MPISRHYLGKKMIKVQTERLSYLWFVYFVYEDFTKPESNSVINTQTSVSKKIAEVLTWVNSKQKSEIIFLEHKTVPCHTFSQKVGHLPKLANYWPLLIQQIIRTRDFQMRKIKVIRSLHTFRCIRVGTLYFAQTFFCDLYFAQTFFRSCILPKLWKK